VVSARRILFNVGTLLPGSTLLPPVRRVLQRRSFGTGGTESARYCYSVWLRHLVLAEKSGLNTNPRIVAELGPGDSLGVGIAALLCGAHRYNAFDVVPHASVQRNLSILEELIALFRDRADIPGPDEFPLLHPPLQSYRFPHRILTAQRLDLALRAERLERLRASLTAANGADSLIRYCAPWFSEDVVEERSVDLIFSQAVLEHIDRLQDTYRAMRLWLAPGGYLSHQVDLQSHGTATEWNGHWTFSDFSWTLIRGKDTWLINREPKSTHFRLLQNEGFHILAEHTLRRGNNLTRGQLAKRFRAVPEDDLTAAGLFFQATPEPPQQQTDLTARF